MKTIYTKVSVDKYEMNMFTLGLLSRDNKKIISVQNGKYNFDLKPLTKASIEFNRAVLLLIKSMSKTFYDYKLEKNILEFDQMLDGYERVL